jgi:hypothetical protein
MVDNADVLVGFFINMMYSLFILFFFVLSRLPCHMPYTFSIVELRPHVYLVITFTLYRKQHKLAYNVRNSPYLDLKKFHTAHFTWAKYKLVCLLEHRDDRTTRGHYICHINTCTFIPWSLNFSSVHCVSSQLFFIFHILFVRL